MTDTRSSCGSPGHEPPSYEQSLHHQRIERAAYDALDSQRSDNYNPGDDYTSNYPQAQESSHEIDHGNNLGRNVVRDQDSESQTSEMLAREVSCTNETLPPIHACLAVTCLVLNICAPGTGTIIAALAIVCCTKRDIEPERQHDMYVNVCYTFLIGIAQMLLVPVLLFGWIWSITWAMALLRLSFDKRNRTKNNDDATPSTSHADAGARNQSFSRPHYTPESGAAPAVSNRDRRWSHATGTAVVETHQPPAPPPYEVAVLALPDVGS